jgi:hypothetical protein
MTKSFISRVEEIMEEEKGTHFPQRPEQRINNGQRQRIERELIKTAVMLLKDHCSDQEISELIQLLMEDIREWATDLDLPY